MEDMSRVSEDTDRVNSETVTEDVAAPVAPPTDIPHKIKIDATTNKLVIVHVGCGGGTGGILASQLLKIIGGLRQDVQNCIRYVGIDGDIFEEKNLGRQLCLPKDIGKNKAEVIVNRYKNAYRIPSEVASFVPKFIKSDEDLNAILHSVFPSDYSKSMYYNGGATVVVIDTLDKNKPRMDCYQFIISTINAMSIGWESVNGCEPPSVYSISCGNGEYTGQTCIGKLSLTGSTLKRVPAMPKEDFGLFDKPYHSSIPLSFMKYPELVDIEADKVEEAMSCADRAAQNVQSMNANNFAATIALNYASAIITAFSLFKSRSGSNILGMSEETMQAILAKEEQMFISVGEVKFNSLYNYTTSSRLTTDNLKSDGLKSWVEAVS